MLIASYVKEFEVHILVRASMMQFNLFLAVDSLLEQDLQDRYLKNALTALDHIKNHPLKNKTNTMGNRSRTHVVNVRRRKFTFWEP